MEELKLKYFCKHCGENKFENFTIGRYTSCKKCRNKAKYESAKKIAEEIKEPSCLKEHITNFIKNDRNNFKGYTIFEVLSELTADNEITKKFNETVENDYTTIINSKLEIISLISCCIDENRRLKEENVKITSEFKVIKEENRVIKEEFKVIKEENGKLSDENKVIKEENTKIIESINILTREFSELKKKL
jgi:hypothetical protein